MHLAYLECVNKWMEWWYYWDKFLFLWSSSDEVRQSLWEKDEDRAGWINLDPFNITIETNELMEDS